MHHCQLIVDEDIISSMVFERRRQRERLLSEPIPKSIISDIRKQMNMNELRIVQSVTKAKKKLQRKYYPRKEREVQSIGDSIQDKVGFGRRLKLFLHQQHKLDLLGYLDQSNSLNDNISYNSTLTKESESNKLKKQLAPKWKPSLNRKLIDCKLFLSLKQVSPTKEASINKRYDTSKHSDT